MLWLILSFLTALFWSAEHIVSKKVVKNIDPKYLAFTRALISSIFSIILIIIFYDNLNFTKNLFLILLPIGIVNASAIILYMKSLKEGDISKVIPLLSLSPIFTLFFAFIILSELPNLISILGILLAVMGTYLINSKKISLKSIFDPFKNIVTNNGTKFMLMVSFIYGLGGVLDKFAITNSSVLTYLLLLNPVSFIFQGIFIYFSDKREIYSKTKSTLKQNYQGILIISLIGLFVITFQYLAISMTFVSFVIAIKRTAALFSIVAAYFIFKEKESFVKVLLGTLIIILGVILIVL